MGRVRVKDYGQVPHNDPRLWPVPSAANKHCRLHWAAAVALSGLQRAWSGSGGEGDILVVSGWRAHRWRDRDHYEAEMLRRYGSVAEGRKWMAYSSPHETGLAMDIGSLGLWPTRNTIAKQRKSELYLWLTEHAERQGWANYHREPWHWEYVACSPALWRMPGPEAPA